MWTDIKLESDVDTRELRKALCFVSEDIDSFHISDGVLRVELKDGCDMTKIIEDINKMIKKFKVIRTHPNSTMINYVQNRQYYANVIDNKELFEKLDDGVFILKDKAAFLFQFFEREFAKLADDMGAIQKIYPVLLPVKDYLATGYIDRSPQYSIFCCNAYENMHILEGLGGALRENNVSKMLKQPYFALSPSACFHVYIEYKGKTLKTNQTVSFTQNVFRNEGRLNYFEQGRLTDYHVREIVFLGSEDYVQQAREECMIKTKKLLEKWGLQACIQTASDPFVLPKMQKYRKIQLLDSSKYEVLLSVGENENLAVASFNLHGTAFTYPFKIEISGCELPVTGCIGFGIERWVIAFLSQFGAKEDNWPDVIYNEYCKRGKTYD